jgi:hypothetical protein
MPTRRDARPPWARRLEARSSHFCWALAGFLALGTAAESLTSGGQPEIVGIACVTGAAWGYRWATRLARLSRSGPDRR